MSFERKIASQRLQPLTGSKPSATGDRSSGIVEAIGGQIVRDQRGHESHEQTMHSLLELRNRPQTSVYSTDGVISPGEYGSYVFRFAGSGNVTLEKPPAVPSEQAHPDLGARTRDWEVSVLVYHASDTAVSWPSSVKWGRIGYAMIGEPAVLEEAMGPPPNPRPSGTADLFALRYMERTGEWWAIPLALSVVSSDPLIADPEATEPEPEEPEEEDATEDETEFDYTDPETGDPLLPEAPQKGLGNLVALHDGGVSYSTDNGHTWTSSTSAPAMAEGISAIAGQGTVITTTDGLAFFSSDVKDYRIIDLDITTRSDLGLVNGGFEAGNLSGWNTVGGFPEVLDTVQPPQQGGRYYLTNNLLVPDFEIEQTLDIPTTENGKVEISGRVFVGTDDTAEVEVSSGWDGETYALPDVRLYPEDPFNANFQSDSLAELKLSGDGIEYISDLVFIDAEIDTGDDEKLSFRFKDGGGLRDWSGGVYHDINSQSDLIYLSSPYGETKQDITINLTCPDRSGLSVQLFVPAGWRPPIGLRNIGSGYYSIDSRAILNQTHLQIDQLEPTGYVQKKTITATGGEWADISMQVPVSVGSPIKITLKGTAASAVGGAIYFDNVAAEIVYEEQASVRAICRDLWSRRHIVATEKKIWEVKGGEPAYLGESPFPADHISADGSMIVVASGARVVVSVDGGNSFQEETAMDSNVQQLFVLSPLNFEDGSQAQYCVIVQENGPMVRISHKPGNAMSLVDLPAAGSVGKDSRGKRWLFTTAGGDVYATTPASLDGWVGDITFEDVKDMPASTTSIVRRIRPTDVGRVFGFAIGSRDLFHSDDVSVGWKLGRSLKAPIIDIQEIK